MPVSKKLHGNWCRSNDSPNVNRKCTENESLIQNKGFVIRIFEIRNNHDSMFCLFLSFLVKGIEDMWSRFLSISISNTQNVQ